MKQTPSLYLLVPYFLKKSSIKSILLTCLHEYFLFCVCRLLMQEATISLWNNIAFFWSPNYYISPFVWAISSYKKLYSCWSLILDHTRHNTPYLMQLCFGECTGLKMQLSVTWIASQLKVPMEVHKRFWEQTAELKSKLNHVNVILCDHITINSD